MNKIPKINQTDELLHQFKSEKEVVFKGEKYLVRDNGSIYRKRKIENRKRPLDEKWTFGKKDHQKGYMNISNHTVHRIVAVAFLGKPPTEAHVVDHIDTNKCNNRPENLRWVTRLENILLNPITLKRVIYAYGSLDNFFDNPQTYKKLEPNIAWMRTVSMDEAKRSREQLLQWAKSDSLPKQGELGEWIFHTLQPNSSLSFSLEDKPSMSPLAIQRNWKWLVEFPNCPTILNANPLDDYLQNLRIEAVFTQNEFGQSLIVLAEKRNKLISVLFTNDNNENTVKPWFVAKITFENGKYIHEFIGSFFELNGAKKVHYNLLNLPFEGESVDDYM